MKPRIVVDCDTGIDDAVALLHLAHLVANDEVELVAAGTVHGNVAAEVGALNTLRVLELAGLPDVPVAVGAARPIAQAVHYAHKYHGTDGLGNTAMPPPAGRPIDGSAAEQIVRLAHRHPGELTLMAVGPLTNVGIALLLEPALPTLLREVVVMGGALNHRGNVTGHAESNIWHDPEAAELVLSAGWPLRLVPLDATHPTQVGPGWLDRLAAGTTDAARFATRIMAHYADVYAHDLGHRAAVVHDALAAVLIADPALARYEERPVRVELRGSATRGATLWDRRPWIVDDRPAVRVAVDSDVRTFQERLLASLL